MGGNTMKEKKSGSLKKWIFRIAALLLLLGIAAAMFVVGRGHTIYFDNKKLETESVTYEPYHKVEVTVGGERVAKLSKKDRGMVETMGQSFSMQLSITEEKGDDPKTVKVNLPLPYNLDGIVINIPALMNGATPDVYMSEFVSLATTTEETEEEEIITDEFAMPMEGEEGDG